MGDRARLILIYNAEGGIFAQLSDAVHKLVSPSTYACSLCALSYGAVSMHGAWRRTLESLPVTPVFLHRGEGKVSALAPKAELPAILLRQGSASPELLIGADELNAMPDLETLTELLLRRLAERGITPQTIPSSG